MIDNYEEVVSSIEQIRLPLILGILDRKINSIANKTASIVRKFEKDKYLFIIEKNTFEKQSSEKFSILNYIKDVETGTRMPFTLSIGFGVNGDNLAQTLDFARIALDLALGRGGDQIVIKNKDAYTFYGGNSNDVEVKSKVTARVKAYAFSEFINSADKVIIMGHHHPDLDCIGSAMGVYRIVTSMNKPCNIVVNQQTSSVSRLFEMIKKSDIYNADLFINSQKALEIANKNTLVVVVDVHRPDMTECQELLDIGRVVLFDHHRRGVDFIEHASLVYHEPSASSTSELVTEMMMYIKSCPMLSYIEADALLAGITVDTKGFAFKTSAKTFEAASYLKKSGADSVKVHMLLQSDQDDYRVKTDIVNNANIYKNIVAISVATMEIENPKLRIAQAADELLNISGIDAAFVIKKIEDSILVSARSIEKINVQIIMEQLGGGGHRTMAAAQVYNMTVDEIIDKIKLTIDKMLKEEL